MKNCVFLRCHLRTEALPLGFPILVFFFSTKGSPDDFTGCCTNNGLVTVQRQVGEVGVLRHSWGTGRPRAGQLWLEASRSLHVASECLSVHGAGVTTWKT